MLKRLLQSAWYRVEGPEDLAVFAYSAKVRGGLNLGARCRTGIEDSFEGTARLHRKPGLLRIVIH